MEGEEERRVGGGQRLPCSPLEDKLREEEGERKKGEYPVFSDPLCYCSPPPALYGSFSISFPLLICFSCCADRKDTCRSLMIQPFSCSRHFRQDSMSHLPLQCLAILSLTIQLLQPTHHIDTTASVSLAKVFRWVSVAVQPLLMTKPQGTIQ